MLHNVSYLTSKSERIDTVTCDWCGLTKAGTPWDNRFNEISIQKDNGFGPQFSFSWGGQRNYNQYDSFDFCPNCFTGEIKKAIVIPLLERKKKINGDGTEEEEESSSKTQKSQG